MINRIIFLWVLIISSFCTTLYSKESLFSQKIAIEIRSSNKLYAVDKLIQSTVLASDRKVENILLLPADAEDLKKMGLKTVNGRVLISSREKGGEYIIALYTAEGYKDTLMDESLRVKKDLFAAQIDAVSIKIVSLLKKKFPPKAKRAMKIIELKRMFLSQFESGRPTWRIGLNVGGVFRINRLEIFYTNTSPPDSYGPDTSYNAFGVNAIVDFSYRNIFASADFTMSSTLDVFARLGAGIGLWRSRLVLGIDFCIVTSSTYLNPDEVPIGVGGVRINYLVANPGMSLRLNITPGNFIEFGWGIPVNLGSVSVLFDDTALIPVNFGLVPFDGEPNIRLLVNVRLNKKLSLYLKYEKSKIRNENDMYGMDPIEMEAYYIGQPNGFDAYLRKVEIKNAYFGIGMKYEI